jgi:hypothetical protein
MWINVSGMLAAPISRPPNQQITHYTGYRKLQMKNTFLIIDTEQYSGNFERKMTGYITGSDDYGELYDKGASVRSRESHPELAEYVAAWQETYASRHMFDVEYGATICGIWLTPGWSNNGRGKCTKLTEGQKMHCGSYQSVAIAIHEMLPESMLVVVKQLVEEYAEQNDITIIGLRYVTQTITTVETEVAI